MDTCLSINLKVQDVSITAYIEWSPYAFPYWVHVTFQAQVVSFPQDRGES